jgi:hypothetical protein
MVCWREENGGQIGKGGISIVNMIIPVSNNDALLIYTQGHKNVRKWLDGTQTA